MRFRRKTSHKTESLHDRRFRRQGGNEVAIHHVDVDPVGSRFLRFGHLLAPAYKICGQDGGAGLTVDSSSIKRVPLCGGVRRLPRTTGNDARSLSPQRRG